MTRGKGFFAGIVVGQLWLVTVLLLGIDHFAALRITVPMTFGYPLAGGAGGVVLVALFESSRAQRVERDAADAAE